MALHRSLAGNTRRHLVETIKTTMVRCTELEYVQRIPLGRLGEIAVLGGVTSETNQSGSETKLTIVDHLNPHKERIAQIRIDGGLYAKYEIPIEPYHPNLFIVRRPFHEPANDDDLMRTLGDAAFSLEKSIEAAHDVMHDPVRYGVFVR